MTEDSRIFFKKSTNQTIKNNLMPSTSGMNIDLLMIWSHMPSNLMEDSFGLAKITMVTCSLMLSRKVTAHLGL